MSKKAKVVVVDDESAIRESFGEVVSGLDYEVKTFISAEEALKNTEWETYDIAFIDYKMPGMSGIDLIKEIRPRAPKLIIIIVIVTAFESEVRDLLSGTDIIRLSVFTILTKPVMIDHLENLMHRIFNELLDKKEKTA